MLKMITGIAGYISIYFNPLSHFYDLTSRRFQQKNVDMITVDCQLTKYVISCTKMSSSLCTDLHTV